MIFKRKFNYLYIFLIVFILGCRSAGPTNKAILSNNKPSKEFVAGFKEGAKNVERSEKRRLRKEARKRYNRSKQFEKNKIR